MGSPDVEWIDFYLGRPLPGQDPPQYQGSAMAGAPPALYPLTEIVDRGLLEPPEIGRYDESSWCAYLTETWSLHAWPHEHETSAETPWAAAYASRSVYLYRYGRLYLVAHLSRWAPAPDAEPAPFPNVLEGSR